MENARKKAVIDNDFLGHAIDTKKYDTYNLICRCFSAFDIDPIIHQLVYEKEVLKEHPVTDRLFQELIINIVKFESFLKSNAEKDYYKMLVETLYKEFHGINIDIVNVFTDWKRKVSLGEMHSLSMCYFIKCDIFLSDDPDSGKIRRMAERKLRILKEVRVYNRSLFCERLASLPDNPISSGERKAFGHTRP